MPDFAKISYFQCGIDSHGDLEVIDTDRWDFAVVSCGSCSITFHYEEDQGSYESVVKAIENVRDLMEQAHKIGLWKFEPLGKEFEEVWDNNVSTLYES